MPIGRPDGARPYFTKHKEDAGMAENLNDMNSEFQQDVSEMAGKYLTFWTDKQLFGVPIADVVQIVQMQEITIVPEYPYYAKGIINLRGSIIPIIDIRLRFGKEEIPYNESTCIIVTNINDNLIGFIVDAVEEVTDIPDEEIAQPPKMSGSDATNAYLTGVGKHEGRVVLLVDTQKMIGNETVDALVSAC